MQEDKRFAKAFTSHLLRFALARELPADALTVDQIVENTAKDNFKLRPIIREVIRVKFSGIVPAIFSLPRRLIPLPDSHHAATLGP